MGLGGSGHSVALLSGVFLDVLQQLRWRRTHSVFAALKTLLTGNDCVPAEGGRGG